MAHGKRRCALKFSLCLQVVAWVALVVGCLTPFWNRIELATTGNLIRYVGLLTNCDDAGTCQTNNLNDYKNAATDKSSMYAVVSITFGIVSMVTQFFLVQTYCLAACNQSCGKKYSPDGLITVSVLTVFMIVTCLVMFELQMRTYVTDGINIKLDYSFGFVIGAATLIFFGGFITIWDRKGQNSKQKVSAHDAI